MLGVGTGPGDCGDSCRDSIQERSAFFFKSAHRAIADISC